MPFDLGFLAAMARPAAPYQPHDGGGPELLAEVGKRKISQGYLDLQRQQQEHAIQRDYIEQLDKEKTRRQTAIDAWLSAVRSGNRADVFVLGKRLKGMGIDVQMPDAFSATGVPSEGEAAPSLDEELGVTVEEPGAPSAAPTAKAKQLAELDAMGEKVAGAISGTPSGQPTQGAPPSPPTPFAPTRPTGELIDPRIVQQAISKPPDMSFAAPATISPFGPGGPSAIKPPTNTWRVKDSFTGTDIELSPEQILADQEKEIDQSFIPLIQMPDLDPIAQRAYAIAHEYAKGQLGFKTPKEAVDAGMAVADKYLMHMYRQGMVSAAQLRAAKRAGGRGGGGGGGGAVSAEGPAPGSKAAIGFSTGLTDDLKDAARDTLNQENYKKNVEAVNSGENALGKLGLNMGVGDRAALGDFIKSISGAQTTDRERSWYTGAAGFWSNLESKIGYVTNGGKLDETLVRELRTMIQKAQGILQQRQNAIREQAVRRQQSIIKNRAHAYGVKDEETLRGYEEEARTNAGLSPEAPALPSSRASRSEEPSSEREKRKAALKAKLK